MKTPIILILSSLIFSGCAGTIKQMEEDGARRTQEQSDAAERLRLSRQNGDTVTCLNKISCEKALILTNAFIQKNSDMRMQFSDSTTVSPFPINTATNNQYGYISMSAIKTPDAGETVKIKLVATCQKMNIECDKKLASIYDSFKPFVESKL
ncbi:MAG: hypothetical protein DID92_2727743532 [Candidatus Nitrotoga sp. SPKER]|nr:MAG: hypothetical protein DID92_2727743532 [Candidatus Nitrotoga sp. SPKER]